MRVLLFACLSPKTPRTSNPEKPEWRRALEEKAGEEFCVGERRGAFSSSSGDYTKEIWCSLELCTEGFYVWLMLIWGREKGIFYINYTWIRLRQYEIIDLYFVNTKEIRIRLGTGEWRKLRGEWSSFFFFFSTTYEELDNTFLHMRGLRRNWIELRGAGIELRGAMCYD